MIEKMEEFFAARVDGYDEHMIQNVEGCEEGYKKMASLLPEDISSLLDLGCGTGMELSEIFKLHPLLCVTGVDLTQEMLNELKRKFPDKNIQLFCQSYFDFDYKAEKYDAAVSFQTMHHFSHEDKIKLYTSVCSAIKQGGMYIESDYMVETQKEEDFYYAENERIRNELKIGPDEFYHYDTPCTINNQIMMLQKSGFADVQKVWRHGNTTIIVAKK